MENYDVDATKALRSADQQQGVEYPGRLSPTELTMRMEKSSNKVREVDSVSTANMKGVATDEQHRLDKELRNTDSEAITLDDGCFLESLAY